MEQSFSDLLPMGIMQWRTLLTSQFTLQGDITLEKKIDVPVLPAEIQKISIKQYPDDVNYVVGQKFFSNGLILLVKYADETEEEITEEVVLEE